MFELFSAFANPTPELEQACLAELSSTHAGCAAARAWLWVGGCACMRGQKGAVLLLQVAGDVAAGVPPS